MKDYILGIDIGSSKICGVVGKLNDENEMQIIGVASSDYEGVLNDDGMHTYEDISSVLHIVISRLREIVNIPLDKAYVSVPISLCEIVETRGVVSFPGIKEISEEDISNVCEVAKFSVGKDKDIVQIDIEEYSVDDNINVENPIGMQGKLLQSEGNAFILSNRFINVYKKCFDKVGIEIEGWVVNSIGISKGILTGDEMQGGVAIIDAGSEKIEVSVFKDNCFVDCVSIPYGGDIITNDISICLKLPKDDSEKLKFKCKTLIRENLGEISRLKVTTEENKTVDVDYGLLVDVINSRVSELFELVHKKLVSEGLEGKIHSYVITGGGLSLFRDVRKIAEDVLKKTVRVGVPDYVGAANPIYATAIGTVVDVLRFRQRFSRNDIQLDEHHEEESSEKESKFKRIIKQFLKSFSNEEEIK